MLFNHFLFLDGRELERLTLLEAAAKSAKKGLWDKEGKKVKRERFPEVEGGGGREGVPRGRGGREGVPRGRGGREWWGTEVIFSEIQKV